MSPDRQGQENGTGMDDPFPPIGEFSGAELLDSYRSVGEYIYDGYQPHIHSWHGPIQERAQELWMEIRNRADTEEPACPECKHRFWAQVPGDPVYCRNCGHEANRKTEQQVNDAWDSMRKEVARDE